MNRLVRHLAVLLLIPALVVDPALAVSLINPLSQTWEIRHTAGRQARLVAGGIFACQALSPAEAAARTNPLSSAGTNVVAREGEEVKGILDEPAAQTEVPLLPFKLQVNPQTLFPLNAVANEFKKRGVSGELVPSLSKGRGNSVVIQLDLDDQGRRTRLARVKIESTSQIAYKMHFPPEDLPSALKAAVWTERSRKRESRTQTTFENLRAMARITEFDWNTGPRFKHGLLAPVVWYRGYLESYLKTCGFPVVTLMVPCARYDATLRQVWRDWAQFSEFYQVTVQSQSDGETLMEYLSFRMLPAPPPAAPAEKPHQAEHGARGSA